MATAFQERAWARASVLPRAPNQLPACLQMPPVPLSPMVCASASHTCLGDSSHLSPCAGGLKSLGGMKLAEQR